MRSVRLGFSPETARLLHQAFGGGADVFETLTLSIGGRKAQFYGIDKASSMIAHYEWAPPDGIDGKTEGTVPLDAVIFARALAAALGLAKQAGDKIELEVLAHRVGVEVKRDSRTIMRRTVPIVGESDVRNLLASAPKRATRVSWLSPAELRGALAALRDVADDNSFRMEAGKDAVIVRALPTHEENFVVCAAACTGGDATVSLSEVYLALVAQTAVERAGSRLEMTVSSEGPVQFVCSAGDETITYLVARQVVD